MWTLLFEQMQTLSLYFLNYILKLIWNKSYSLKMTYPMCRGVCRDFEVLEKVWRRVFLNPALELPKITIKISKDDMPTAGRKAVKEWRAQQAEKMKLAAPSINALTSLTLSVVQKSINRAFVYSFPLFFLADQHPC